MSCMIVTRVSSAIMQHRNNSALDPPFFGAGDATAYLTAIDIVLSI